MLAKYIKTRNLPYCAFEPKAKAGTQRGRQNVENFIAWARDLGLRDPDVFNADDLIRIKDARRVLWGLLDVARRTRRMRLPRTVWLERLKHLPPSKCVALLCFVLCALCLQPSSFLFLLPK